jgi:hypothetical protein
MAAMSELEEEEEEEVELYENRLISVYYRLL